METGLNMNQRRSEKGEMRDAAEGGELAERKSRGEGQGEEVAFRVETWRPGSLFPPTPQVGLERWPVARTSLWAHVATGVHPRKQTPL